MTPEMKILTAGARYTFSLMVAPYLLHADLFHPILPFLIPDLLELLTSSFLDSDAVCKLTLHPNYSEIMMKEKHFWMGCLKYEGVRDHPRWLKNVLKMIRALELPLKDLKMLLIEVITPLVKNLNKVAIALCGSGVHRSCLETLTKLTPCFLSSEDETKICIGYVKNILSLCPPDDTETALIFMIGLIDTHPTIARDIASTIPLDIIVDQMKDNMHLVLQVLVGIKPELEDEQQLFKAVDTDVILRVCKEGKSEEVVWAAYALLECFQVKPAVVVETCDIDNLISFICDHIIEVNSAIIVIVCCFHSY